MKMKWVTLAVLGLLAVQAQAATNANNSPVVHNAPPEELTNAGLTALQLADGKVQLSWADTTNNESGYVVQRSAHKGPWIPVATLPANSTSTTLAAPPQGGTDYRYRVVAVNGGSTGHKVSSAAAPSVAP